MQRQFYGSDSEQAATTLSNLGSLYQDAGRIDEAEAAYNEAMVMRAKVLGKQHPDYANTLMLFASLRRQMGRDVEAEDLNKQALTVCQATGQQRCAATVLDNLGSLYFDKGRIPEALDRLVALYTAMDKPDELQKYQELNQIATDRINSLKDPPFNIKERIAIRKRKVAKPTQYRLSLSGRC